MMDMLQLEKERKKALLKLTIFTVLIVGAICYILYKVFVLNGNVETVEIVIAIAILVLSFSLSACLPKEFEAKFKKYMITDILKKVVGDNGEIKWVNNSYYASTSRTQIEKWNDEFKKEISYTKVDESLDNRIDELEENKENLSEEEKNELNQLWIQYNDECSKHDEQEYKKFLEKLNALQNKVDKQEKPKEKDLLHIDFYKAQIKKYEEKKEIKKLQDKRDNIFTKEEQLKIDEYSDLFNDRTLSDEEKESLSIKEQAKYEEYNKLLEKWRYALTDEEQEKINNYYDKQFNSLKEDWKSTEDISISYNLFERHCEYDEMFYGTYKNTEFTILECDQTDGSGKSETTFLKGNVVQIPCDISYKNKIVIMEKKFFIAYMWEDRITKGLKELKLDIPLGNKKKIFTNSVQGTEEILNGNFIDFINNLDSKYSYAFVDGKMYIIWNTKRDYFKLGSLFKNVDDEKQYVKFKNDMMEVLDIVERVSKLNFKKK